MAYSPPSAVGVGFGLASGYSPPLAQAVDFSHSSQQAGGGVLRSGVDASVGLPYARATRHDLRTAIPWGPRPHRDRTWKLLMEHGHPVGERTAAGWDRIPRRDEQTGSPWADTGATAAGSAAPAWHQIPDRDERSRSGWDGSIAPRSDRAGIPWLVPPAIDLIWRAPYFDVDQYGAAYAPPAPVYVPPAAEAVAFALDSGYATPAADALAFVWREPPPPRPIQPRDAGQTDDWDPLIPPKDAGDTIPWGPFGRADSIGIDITYPQQPPEEPPEPPVVPPEQEVYLLMPSITAQRVSDGLPVLVNAVRIATDRDSWCWQIDATLARGEDLAAVMPGANGPVELEVAVNGYTWVFLVESYRRSRAYNTSSYQIRGRSRSATLAAPYAIARTHTEANLQSTQQLALAELEFLPWTLDWQAEDWSVPGGVWSYQDLTPLQAILRIAEAAGAVVQTHPSQQILTVAPRYVVSPWQWATALADVVAPDHLMTSLSLRWQPGPAHNAVYVSGKAQGVLVHVLRGGTSMDTEAPMAVDALITDRLAGRERGRQILAQAGNRAAVPIQTPLLPDPEPPGLILPGQLVQVQEGGETWQGQAMGITVEATRQNATTVRQSIEVERWYG